jgi:sterol desaturase/sphingolipid hydroxylase (fatty acid hydroxylase superfamily)
VWLLQYILYIYYCLTKMDMFSNFSLQGRYSSTATAIVLDQLPPVQSVEFAVIASLALILPYLFIGGIYTYHFYGHSNLAKLRKIGDEPLYEHVHDWKSAILKPEGITAVIAYMFMGGALSVMFPKQLGWLVSESVRTLSFSVNPMTLLLHFVVFDSLMWAIHYVQHHWRWLYYNTHAVHHTIKSPTMIVALTGYLPDTCMLIILPLHITVSIVPGGNFTTVFVFAMMSLFHLHCIHSEFGHAWDPLFRKIGIVNSWDHHVHHLKPRTNLAHFFTGIDRLFGTYQDPMKMKNLLVNDDLVKSEKKS